MMSWRTEREGGKEGNGHAFGDCAPHGSSHLVLYAEENQGAKVEKDLRSACPFYSLS